MPVIIKALGISTRSHRRIPYRVTIGRYSQVFTGTISELNDFVSHLRGILSELS